MFYLVRHGAHDRLGHMLCGRMAGIHIGEVGRWEADLAGERLAREGIGRIETGPLERTRETAERIALRVGLVPEVAPELDEIEFGAWSGRTFDELSGDPEWDRWNAERSVAPTPGGETMGEAQARIVRHLHAISAGPGPERIVLVTHGDLIKAALAHVLDLSLDHLQRFEIAPGSISIIAMDGRSARVAAMNVLPQ